ncbi:Peptidase family M23/M37 [hydrothermal vent metagenome]|uniref:Peptidase family M23/M37 n=1 Tax=hydrothermal vent metagenome TaxID=652676 RepID=A0A3B0YXF6_9ZZZZ
MNWLRFNHSTLVFIITFFLLLINTTANAYQYPANYVRDHDSPGISAKLFRKCPVADGFDFPVGKPNAKGYYNAQKFTRNHHLADDWNGVGGGNTDLGDPIYSIANGIVVQTKNYGPPWGRVTRILHNAGTVEKPVYVESLYAHMRTILIKRGLVVKRGQKIGTIGNANGTWWAHLHLEIRTSINKSIGVGYSRDTTGYTDPTKYIKKHRPAWRYAARKRRLTRIKRSRRILAAKRLALKKRQTKILAKGKKSNTTAATVSTILRLVELSLNYLSNDKASTAPEKSLGHAETVASNIWSASMLAVSVCENTGATITTPSRRLTYQTYWLQIEPAYDIPLWPNKSSNLININPPKTDKSFWEIP